MLQVVPVPASASGFGTPLRHAGSPGNDGRGGATRVGHVSGTGPFNARRALLVTRANRRPRGSTDAVPPGSGIGRTTIGCPSPSPWWRRRRDRRSRRPHRGRRSAENPARGARSGGGRAACRGGWWGGPRPPRRRGRRGGVRGSAETERISRYVSFYHCYAMCYAAARSLRLMVDEIVAVTRAGSGASGRHPDRRRSGGGVVWWGEEGGWRRGGSRRHPLSLGDGVGERRRGRPGHGTLFGSRGAV